MQERNEFLKFLFKRELIKVNDAIRNHPIESVGKRLRSAMTAMKVIKTEVEQTTVLS